MEPRQPKCARTVPLYIVARVYCPTGKLGTIVSQVWTGDVVESPDFEGIPRSISMTWSDCDVEVGDWYQAGLRAGRLVVAD